MSDMVDFDLDFINIMKDFPEDEINSYIYMRGSRNGNYFKSRIMMAGSYENIQQSIRQCMNIDEDFKACVLNAVLNFVQTDKKSKEVFIEVLI